MLMLFPMELSNQSNSSETEDNESQPGTPSKHHNSPNLSNSDMGDGNDHESDLVTKVRVPHTRIWGSEAF